MKKNILFIILVFIFSISSSFSQEDWFSMPDEQTEEVHGIHHHHLGLFLGANSSLNNGHIAFSSGLDYTYFFAESDPLIGIGALVEATFAEEMELVIGPSLTLQPWHELKFFLAPSLLYVDLKEEEIDELHKTGTTKFLLRFGTAYMFHFDNFSLSPSISADVVGASVHLVYGIGFGIGF